MTRCATSCWTARLRVSEGLAGHHDLRRRLGLGRSKEEAAASSTPTSTGAATSSTRQQVHRRLARRWLESSRPPNEAAGARKVHAERAADDPNGAQPPQEPRPVLGDTAWAASAPTTSTLLGPRLDFLTHRGGHACAGRPGARRQGPLRASRTRPWIVSRGLSWPAARGLLPGSQVEYSLIARGRADLLPWLVPWASGHGLGAAGRRVLTGSTRGGERDSSASR